MSHAQGMRIPYLNITFPQSLIGPILISCVVLAAHISFGILDSYQKLLLAIGASFLTEAVLHKVMFGKGRNMTSAYVSGISAGILVRSPLFWPFALTAMISIASKYVFRYKGRHIWNPTNFGIVVMLIIASDSMAVLSIQWGNNMWAMFVIWTIGLLTLWKVNKFNICGAYIVGFFLFALIRSLIIGDAYLSIPIFGEKSIPLIPNANTYLTEIAPITGPMYQLFVLFMITDPRTVVKSRLGQSFVAFIIAFVELIFRLNEAVYAPFYALFIVGPIALFIEDWWMNRRKKALISDVPNKP